MKTPNTSEMIEHMLDALETPSRTLTKWEENFIESITEYYKLNNRLSERQFEILEKIYAEKTE